VAQVLAAIFNTDLLYLSNLITGPNVCYDLKNSPSKIVETIGVFYSKHSKFLQKLYDNIRFKDERQYFLRNMANITEIYITLTLGSFHKKSFFAVSLY
jgi:hypothetical protein